MKLALLALGLAASALSTKSEGFVDKVGTAENINGSADTNLETVWQ